MIIFNNADKSYGKTKANRNIDLKFEPGKIYGIMGKSHSGKSTLLKLASGQIKPSSGDVTLDGLKIFEKPDRVGRICLVREEGIGIDDLKVNKMLKLASLAYDNWDEDFKNQLITEFGIDTNQRYYKLSREEQAIVGLITGLASRAEWTLFDEPSSYLEVENLMRFCEILRRDLEMHPRTVLISSRKADKTAELFDRVVILRDGKVILSDDIENIKSKIFYVSGDKEVAKDVEIYKNLIFKESFGDTVVLGVFDEITGSLVESYKARGLVTSKMPFRNGYIYFTEDLIEREQKEYEPVEIMMYKEGPEADIPIIDETDQELESVEELDSTDRISKTEVIEKIVTEDGEEKMIETLTVESVEGGDNDGKSE